MLELLVALEGVSVHLNFQAGLATLASIDRMLFAFGSSTTPASASDNSITGSGSGSSSGTSISSCYVSGNNFTYFSLEFLVHRWRVNSLGNHWRCYSDYLPSWIN